MIIKCHAKDCAFNNDGTCSKDEIEIAKISSYDDNSAECVDYEKEYS